MQTKICDHKNLFPINHSEVWGTFVIMILQTLATISGLGGGGIIIPMLMAFFNFDTMKAVTISCFTIFCGGIIRFIMTIDTKHPTKNAVVIEYGLVNVMIPSILVGTVCGVMFNLVIAPYH